MPQAHRHGDKRTCTAKTRVTGQSTVFVNNKLWAVKEDPNTHEEGGLIPTGTTVFIENKLVIVHTPDKAKPDNKGHIIAQDQTGEGSPNVFAYS